MSSKQPLNLTLKVWRQEGENQRGRLVTYRADDISPEMSFLEMIDVVNERLTLDGKGAHRLRSRLPGRNLRHVRRGGERPSPRTRKGDHPLSASYAAF